MVFRSLLISLFTCCVLYCRKYLGNYMTQVFGLYWQLGLVFRLLARLNCTRQNRSGQHADIICACCTGGFMLYKYINRGILFADPWAQLSANVCALVRTVILCCNEHNYCARNWAPERNSWQNWAQTAATWRNFALSIALRCATHKLRRQICRLNLLGNIYYICSAWSIHNLKAINRPKLISIRL